MRPSQGPYNKALLMQAQAHEKSNAVHALPEDGEPLPALGVDDPLRSMNSRHCNLQNLGRVMVWQLELPYLGIINCY